MADPLLLWAFVSVLCMTLVVHAHWGRALSDHNRPRRLLVRLGGGLVVALVALLALQRLRPELHDLAAPTQAGMIGLAGGWLATAYAVRRTGTHVHSFDLTRGLVGMAVSQVLVGIGRADRDLPTLAGIAVMCSVAASFVDRASGDLDTALAATRSRVREVVDELADARETVDTSNRRRADVTHDARNAIVAIRAAMFTLRRHGHELEAETVERLRSGVVQETGLLEALLVENSPPPEVFDLGVSITGIVAGQQALGGTVTVIGCAEAQLALGRESDFARAFQNILVNAREHAPGTPVTVSVARRRNRMKVAVSDMGPGLSPAMVDVAFERRVQGDGGSGSGLGLSIVRQLLLDQGGSVEFEPAVRGARVVMWLPRPGATSPGPVLARNPDSRSR
ncbi:sensor histidine kinase [Nocardioides marmorisolisilvae]|uniref:histidine kinase n=1 Tax=Nocardioides marmorisolisilvae TaxID=1542737 RepID=A0A3N0DX63_9ACTN|nr:HAMP domain-containing sensor histidine kinase [Nocardioides marmorisolisilvae]RNL80185.1 sensor histidine kinase [Nocardioides marmorisolisilvae]